MSVLWTNLTVVYFFSALARYFSKPLLNGNSPVRPNRLLAFISAACIILVSGLRKNIGDTYAYMQSYANTNFTWEIIKKQKGIGFNLYQMILQKFSHDPQFMIFITALITNALIVFVLYKYARLFELALFVYLTGGLFITGMNGTRQFLAAAIIFAASKYLFNGNWIKYILVVLLAAQIHSSAYVLIPIYFLVRTKAWSRTTILLLCVAVGIVLGFSQFSSILFSALDSTTYGGYGDANLKGSNILNTLIFACPIVIAYLGRAKLRKICPNSDCIVNMSILGLVFMIISTQSWIFARFSYFFGLYFILLISWIVKLFSDKIQNTLYYLIVILYFIVFYYENVKLMGLIYKSNFLLF